MAASSRPAVGAKSLLRSLALALFLSGCVAAQQSAPGDPRPVQGSLTTFLASWGAVVSTIAIVWNIRRDFLDRGRLKVNCYHGCIVSGESRSPTYLVFHVTNVGRRDVQLTTIGGELSSDTHFLVPLPGTINAQQLPRRLKPGEIYMGYAEPKVLDENPRNLWAIDSLNNYWKFPRRSLKHLLRKHKAEYSNAKSV